MSKKKDKKKLKRLQIRALKLIFWHYIAIEKALNFYVSKHSDSDPDKPQNLDIKTAKWDFANNFQAFSDNELLIFKHIKKRIKKEANKNKEKKWAW